MNFLPPNHLRRSIAEQRVRDSAPLPPTSTASQLATFHELQVHQVELEMQNEELLAARDELEAYAKRFIDLYDHAPVAYFSLTANGTIRRLNLLAAHFLDQSRELLIGKSLYDWLIPDHSANFARFLSSIFSNEIPDPCVIELRPAFQSRNLRVTGAISPDGTFCRVAAMDITALRRAESISREKHEELEQIFHLSQDMLCLACEDGVFLRVNPAFERILGHSVLSMHNRKFIELVHADDKTRTLDAMDALKSGNTVLDFINRYRHADGSYRWIEWRATPSRTGIYSALGRDITDRKRAEDALKRSEQKFRSIVQCSPTAMYSYEVNENNRLILMEANPAADQEMKICHQYLIGKSAEEAFPGLIGTGIPELFHSIALGNLETQTFICHYDTAEINGFFEVRAFQTHPGMMVAAFSDVSERIRSENELKRSQDELELRVQRRTAQLQERTRQLRALASELTLAEERERQRIAGIMHDHLQQLLVAALLNLGMLKNRQASHPSLADFEQIEAILRDAVENTRSLTAELSPTVLHQCGLAAALKWLGCWCLHKYSLVVDVESEDDIELGQDVSVTLFRCVRELIFNIVKHSGVNRATIQMSRPAFGSVMIEIADAGSGFDLQQVRAREGQEGGFGLFNVRERLELLGGRLEIESSPGQGSRFSLWVPELPKNHLPKAPSSTADSILDTAVPQENSPSSPTPKDPGSPRKIRIIVADDHTVVREGLIRVFQTEPDFEVVGQAADGREALLLARQWNPDFVIMDLNMPQMDGLRATTIISRELPEVRVLGLSTHADKEQRIAMIRAGAMDLFHKNISSAHLTAALRDHAASNR